MSLADQHLGIVDSGHHMRVGHQPVVGVEEAGALDTAPAGVVAVDLEHTLRGSRNVRVLHQPLRRPANVDDRLARERLEVAREEAGADHVVEGLQGLGRRPRQHLVDLVENQRVPDGRSDSVDPRPGDGQAERPRDQEYGGRAQRCPTDCVDGPDRLPPDALAELGSGELEQCLTERRGHDHDEQRAERDPHRRVRVAERYRSEPDAEQAAEEQSGGRARPGDEPLPVAAQRVGDHEHDKDPVEQVHRPGPSWKFVLGAGRSGNSTSSPVLP